MNRLLRHGVAASLAATIILIPSIVPTHAAVLVAETAASDDATTFTFSSPNRGVLVLLDMSGSMNEQDSSGTLKIDAAKAALSEQVQEMPAQSNIGLMTYPSMTVAKNSNCNGAALHLEVSSDSLAAMNSTLQGLSAADGGTPTSDALLQAADHLQANGLKEVTIVLVSDGESNCGSPPCETVKALHAQGFEIVVNTVGFDISAEGAAELQCVAGASNGRYVDAKDSEQLRQVLKSQLNNGVDMALSAPQTPIPTQSAYFSITATTSVSQGKFAQNVDLKLEAATPGAASAITQPSRKLGNISPPLPQLTTWRVAPPSNSNVEEVRYRVIASVSGLESTTSEVTVHFTDSALGGITLSKNLQPFKQVLVLGDSYSSGEGAGDNTFPYFAEKDQAQECHRSHNQYASWLFKPSQVTILACSGAVSSNLDYYGQHGEPTQLAQLSHSLNDGYHPDLIFLTISGNDIGFGNIATACAMNIWITTSNFRRGSCPASKESGALYSELTGLVSTVNRTVNYTLIRIAAEFQKHGLPTPPIIVSKYPEMMSKVQNVPTTCEGFTPIQSIALGYAFEDFNEIQGMLNSQIDQGVQESVRQGIPAHVVRNSEHAIPTNHNICSPSPWFVPLTVARKFGNGPEIMHPNIAGHQAMATAINNWAESLATAPSPKQTNVSQAGLVPRLFYQWAWTKLKFNPDDLTIKPATRYKLPYGETEIQFAGKAPVSDVTLYIKSVPRALGQVLLDEQGTGSITINLQSSFVTPGDHTLNIIATKPDGSVVHESMAITIPQPFPTLFWAWLGLALLLLVSAVVLLVRARSRGTGRLS